MVSDRETIRTLRKQLERKDDEMKRKDAELKAERALWRSDSTIRRLDDAADASLMHKLESLDCILNDPKDLHSYTGMTPEQMEWLIAEFTGEIKSMRMMPLFRDGGMPRGSDPGNRCKLYARHVLLLMLTYLRSHPSQEVLGAQSGVDQSTISRYFEDCGGMVEAMLPTANAISQAMAECRTAGELKRFLPGRNGGEILVDGSRTPHVRPGDQEAQKKMYSGKIRRHSLNTCFGSSLDRIIVWMSKTHEGRMHDSRIGPEIGGTIRSLVCKNMPKKYRVCVTADLGFMGMRRELPGAMVDLPEKRGKGRDLSRTQRERNRRIRRKRTPVEHRMKDLKDHAITTAPYSGSPEEFNRHMNIVTGLVNFKRLFPQIKSKRGPYGRLIEERRRRRR